MKELLNMAMRREGNGGYAYRDGGRLLLSDGARRSGARGGDRSTAKCGRGLRCMGKRAERLYDLPASPGAG